MFMYRKKNLPITLIMFGFLTASGMLRPVAAQAQGLRCIAFSPYVQGYNPNTGPHPPASLINTLLDKIVQQTSFRCIMTYGVHNRLNVIIPAAKAKGVKVIAIIWLEKGDTAASKAFNSASITRGIQLAKTYPKTIIRLSCGSEFRTRNGTNWDSTIKNCVSRLRSGEVIQPITSIDTWWEWCNRSTPCQQWSLANSVDWIGINVFPWWENKFSGLYPCTTAAQAAKFHIQRVQDVMNRYPGKKVILTEFGWPAGPSGYREVNVHNGQRCGEASQSNQNWVITHTIQELNAKSWPGVVFESFREPWKVVEGKVGPYWGICNGISPYTCRSLY